MTRRSSSKTKQIVWWLGGIAALILIAAVAVWGYSRVVTGIIREGIAEAFPGGETSCGEISFDPFTSEVVITDLEIGNPPGYNQNHAAIDIKEIYAVINASALWRNVIHIEELRIRQCRITLEFRKIPTTSWLDWMQVALNGPEINLYELMSSSRAAKASAKRSAAGNDPPRARWFYRVDRCEITGCRVFFGNLAQVRNIVEMSVKEFFEQTGEPENPYVRIVLRMIVNKAARKAVRTVQDFFQNGVALPDYILSKPVGQNEASSAREVAAEIFRNHWEEIVATLRERWEKFKERYLGILSGVL